MKTFLANFAAKPSDTRLLGGVKRWVLMRQDLAAVRDGSSRSGHRLRCRYGADPDRARGFALSVLHPRGSGRCRSRRAGTGPAGHRPQRRPRPLRDHDLSEPYGSEVVNAVAFALIGAGIAWSGERAPTQPYSGGNQRGRRPCARGSPHLDPRHRAGRDDRDR